MRPHPNLRIPWQSSTAKEGYPHRNQQIRKRNATLRSVTLTQTYVFRLTEIASFLKQVAL